MHVLVYIPVKNVLTQQYGKVPSTLARAVKRIACSGSFFAATAEPNRLHEVVKSLAVHP